ncbi:hypothetical protein, partial [uncultured Cloacibacillus sp.]|uniref:hypothetical protein n=1 Tax=uncultured Cloacibacillus sp. TaxID=889794 RepID=UPI002615D4F9
YYTLFLVKNQPFVVTEPFLLFISAKDEPAAPFTPPRKRRYNNLTRRRGLPRARNTQRKGARHGL